MLKEVTLLSFGGQGGVTAARILALAAVKDGMYAQAIPQFGAERRGSLVRSYLRLSDSPVRRHSSIKKADVVSIFAEKILRIVNIEDYLKKDGLTIINADKGGDYCINASEIALKLNLVSAGWPIVNTAMSGAMAKVLGIRESCLIEAIKETFHGELAEKNAKAAEEAYRGVSKCQDTE